MSDPIRGRTIRFTFSDGPMANKTFEHVFDANGTVHFRMLGVDAPLAPGKKPDAEPSKDAAAPKYELAMVGSEVGAVAYLGGGGYTLTTILDFKRKELAAFSSNEKGVTVQRGTFEYADAAADVTS